MQNHMTYNLYLSQTSLTYKLWCRIYQIVFSEPQEEKTPHPHSSRNPFEKKKRKQSPKTHVWKGWRSLSVHLASHPMPICCRLPLLQTIKPPRTAFTSWVEESTMLLPFRAITNSKLFADLLFAELCHLFKDWLRKDSSNIWRVGTRWDGAHVPIE